MEPNRSELESDFTCPKCGGHHYTTSSHLDGGRIIIDRLYCDCDVTGRPLSVTYEQVRAMDLPGKACGFSRSMHGEEKPPTHNPPGDSNDSRDL